MKKRKAHKKIDFTDIRVQELFKTLPRNYDDLYLLYATAESAFVEHQKLLVRVIKSTDSEEKTQFQIRQLQSHIVVIVFSHLFMEAVIYDYGATNTSDSYMKRHIDKLDFLSKWVIVPELVTNNSFPTDSQAYELLSKLKYARNTLVHFKTKNNPCQPTYEDLLKEEDERIGVIECFNCMSETLKELNHLGKNKWPLFKWGYIKNLINKSHLEIVDYVRECIRNIINND